MCDVAQEGVQGWKQLGGTSSLHSFEFQIINQNKVWRWLMNPEP